MEIPASPRASRLLLPERQTMNTKVIGIIAAIVVIAAGVWFFTQSKNTNEVQTDTASTEAEAELQQENTSLKELMSRDREVKCTYESADGGSGTIYATRGRARGDFEVTTDGKPSMGHMIANQTTGYFWMEGQTTGMKMMIDADANASTNNQGVDPNKNYDFNCESWRADASVFTPPTNVQFQEFKIPEVPAAGAGAGAKMDAAAVCNSLPEPSKSQCLTSLPTQ